MKRFGLVIFIFVIGLFSFLYFDEDISPPRASQSAQMTHRTVEDRVLSDQLKRRFWKLTDVELEAKAAVLIDAETGHILFQHNSDVSLPTASMSKLMTELLVLEAIDGGQIDWDTEVPISDYAYDISNTPRYATVHLDQAQSYTVKELFDAMAIHSANGATIALAEHVSGSERLFVQEMNQRAAELGLHTSTFVNSTGLDNKHLGDYYSVGTVDDLNKMSALDLAKLARHLIFHHPILLEITSQPYNFANDQEYPNTNLMLTDSVPYLGVDGLKTGYTKSAGYGFTGTVQQGDTRFISVVMGSESIQERFLETEILYDHAFDQFPKFIRGGM